MKHTDNNHKVYVNSKGERVMRVSQVIKRLAKEQLIIWANMLGFKGISYKQELERTATIGTMAHAIAENYVNPKRLAVIDFEEFGITDPRDQKEARNEIKSFVKWFDGIRHKFKVLHTEFTVVGETLGGTIDCIIEDWDDPEKVIFVDYKSSGFYLTQFLQLAAYVMIYEEVYGKNKVGGVMVVAMDKKHGEKAQARLIRRKNLKPFMMMFKSLFETAYCEEILNACFPELMEKIS